MKPGFNTIHRKQNDNRNNGCIQIHQTNQRNSKNLQQQKDHCYCVWDQQGVLLVEFMEPGTTITAAVYCETLRRLRRAIQNKRRGKLTAGVVLIHDNARPHTAGATQRLLEQFGWDIFDHPPYSPDLAPCDFHLFLD